MPTIEDELRRVMDGFSAGDRPSAGRRDAVRRRIVRHRRRRAAFTAGAVVAVLAVSLLALSGSRRTAPHPPANTPAILLPGYDRGGKLVASAHGELPRVRTASFTFTPTTWDFTIDDECAAPMTQWLHIKVNATAYVEVQCSPGDESGYPEVPFDAHEQFWTSMGVRLGEPTTVTATIAPGAGETLADQGAFAVGAYVPVPFDQYPIPPRPSIAPTVLGSLPGGPGQPLLTIIGGAATTKARQFTMPDQFQVTVEMIVPGTVSVYIDGVQVAECDSWGWLQVCDGGPQTTGSGRLSRFTPGQSVTVTVLTQHVTGIGTWQVVVTGR